MNITLTTETQDVAYACNAAGNLVRIVPMSASEVVRFRSLGNMLAPGVTRAEWEEHPGSVVAGGQYGPGGLWVRPDGSLKIVIAREVVNGQLVESIVLFEAGEWTGNPPKVSVAPAVIAKMIQGSRYVVLAVQNGVLTVEGC